MPQSLLADGDGQRFWRPSDGQLVPLIVQSFDSPLKLPATSQWTRSGRPTIEVSSLQLLSYWIISPILEEGSGRRRFTRATVAATAFRLVAAWPVTCFVLAGLDFKLGAFSFLSRAPKLDGDDNRYDPVVVNSKLGGSTGAQEEPEPSLESTLQYLSNIRLDTHLQPASQPSNGISEPSSSQFALDSLSLRPRYLCFIVDAEKKTYKTVKVSDYLRDHGAQADTEFVFISYTRLQFRIATDDEIDAYPYPNEQARESNRQVAREDRKTLISWGVDAALSAGKRAFWLDFECVRDGDGIARSSSNSEDVYHICDIMRAAHSMIIGLSPPADAKVACVFSGKPQTAYSAAEVTKWLRQWGSRLWTLPEVLLCPNEYRIKLYAVGDEGEPKSLAKRNFAERAWDDAEAVKELMNHFEGSAILTPMHLLTAALECFARRKTDQFSQGDIAYAIMGLVPHRQRPEVNHSDSGFRAFARLSLAIDSGSILERLMCLSPRRVGDAQWFDTSDGWGTSLRDIHPACRVVDVAEDDALILDDLVGATIHWDHIKGSDNLGNMPSFALWLLGRCLSFGVLDVKLATHWLIVPAIAELYHKGIIKEIALGTFMKAAFFGAISHHLIVALMAPLIFLYCSKSPRQATPWHWLSREGIGTVVINIWTFFNSTLLLIFNVTATPKSPKARLIGIEGTVNSGTIERYLWGFNWGRLTTVNLVEDVMTATEIPDGPEPRHAFTLVDTEELVITHFRCSKPPTAMFIGGHERSMNRALLCSYDWKTQTFHREKVLRVGSRVLDLMRPVDRIRLKLCSSFDTIDTLNYSSTAEATAEQEPLDPDVEAGKSHLSSFQVSATQIARSSRWKIRTIFLLVIFMGVYTYTQVRTFFIIDRETPGFDYDAAKIPLIFGFSFVAAQVPAYLLLMRLPMIRVMPFLSAIHGTLLAMRFLVAVKFVDFRLWTTLMGVSIGLILPQLVVYTWAWFPPNRVGVCMFTWAVFGPQLATMVSKITGVVAKGTFGIIMRLLTGCLIGPSIFYFLSLHGSDAMGLPTEVPWLDSPSKLHYAQGAALGKVSSRQLNDNTIINKTLQWRPPLWKRTVRAVLFFGFAIVNGFVTTMVPLDVQSAGTIWIVLPAAAICLILLLPRPLTPVMMACLILPAIGRLPTDSFLELMPFAQPFIHPLLWSLIVEEADTWVDSVVLLSLSLAGMGIGMSLVTVPGAARLPALPFLILMVLEALILGIMGIMRMRRRRM